MPNNKIVDREALKATRQAFQNALENGQIVPSKAISTKQIEAVSSDSGTIQEAPFISQGTGTANGTVVVDTSPVGKHLEKQGNAIVYNQQIDPTNFRNGSANAWSYDSNTKLFHVVLDNTAGSSNTSAAVSFLNSHFVLGHKYYVRFKIVSGTQISSFYIIQSNQQNLINNPIITADRNFTGLQFNTIVVAGSAIDFYCTLEMFDLTKWFNGDIPQDILDTPAHFSRYYNGDLTYNLGEIRFGTGRYLECGQSRNIWDEETSFSSNTLSSANYIKVLPDTVYHFYATKNSTVNYYDSNQSLINTESVTADTNFTTPSNCRFIKFEIANYGTTYNNDITISLYYSTGDSYDEYFPYVASKIYETGTEVLRKVGATKDIKYPNGTIIRSCKSAVYDGVNYGIDITSDGSSEGGGIGIWKTIGNYTKFYLQKSDFRDMITEGQSRYSNLFAYTNLELIEFEEEVTGVSIYYVGNNLLIMLTLPTATASTVEQANAWLQNNNVTLCYQLATPTTEQGTPFSENIEINDYSYMSWLDTNNLLVDVPQGCKIFYPADYALLIDSLNSYTNGDVTSLAKKSDLLDKQNKLTQSTDLTSTTQTLTLTANTRYALGTLTALNITFPSSANDGDEIIIGFVSGSTATTLTRDTTNAIYNFSSVGTNVFVELNAQYKASVNKWVVYSAETTYGV